MKQGKKSFASLLVMTLLCALFLSTSAFGAELEGNLSSVDSSRITGWAWNKGVYDETVHVELHFYKDGSDEAVKVETIPADSYSADLSSSIGDGYHAFDYQVNWEEMSGNSYKVEAYATAGEAKVLLSGTSEYKPAMKTGDTKAGEETGPGVKKEEVPAETETPVAEQPVNKKGQSLGIFTTTGYCSCRKCSGGSGKTYSGTVPQARHTISADISVLPIGTKVMIGDTVYTVEDVGSGVNGRKVDIYFGSHSEALAHGRRKQEVFAVNE